MRRVAQGLLGAVLSVGLGGCGTTLPIMDVQYAEQDRFDQLVASILNHVRCELGQAAHVQIANRPPLKTWGAKVYLDIKALDKGTANPGAAGLNPALTFTFATVGQFEADATREMTMTYYLPFEELEKDQVVVNGGACTNHVVKPIAGDLGIAQTLESTIQTWDGRLLSQDIEDGRTLDTITHHVTFSVQGGISLTPSWKFTRVTANSSGSFLGANRTETNELLITMGPTVLKDVKVDGKLTRVFSPSNALDEAFQIERLRSAFTNRQ